MIAVATRRPPAFFSLGAIVRLCWRPEPLWAPWVCSASALTVLAMWDVVARAGRPDFILLGLAGYELILGLTE
jgi:hypothetical protein